MTTITDFLAKLTAANSASSLVDTLPKTFPLTVSGPYPLAKHVDIPGSQVGGELLLSLRQLNVAPIAVQSIEPDADRGRVTVTLNAATLTGHYEIFGLETPEITLDTGGLMAPLSAMTLDGDSQITDKQYDQLQQANDQRTRLNQTVNGRETLRQYDQYNDDYNDAFNTSKILRAYWAQDDMTQQMADHTSDAVTSGTDVINPSDRKFGTGATTPQRTYNENAWSQKLHLWTACNHLGKTDAAAAALKFSLNVATNTGNSQKKIVPMTREQVYTSVQNANGASNAATESAASLLTASLERAIDGSHTEADIALFSSHGYDLGDENLARLRAIRDDVLRRNDPKVRQPLWQGDFSVDLGASRYVFALTGQPDGAVTVKLASNTLRVPPLGLDDSTWNTEAGRIARERIDSAQFIRGILEDRIASQLTRHLRRIADGRP